VLRSPRNDGAIKSDETNPLLLASEAATLMYIRANSIIPVPEVFAYRSAILPIQVWNTDSLPKPPSSLPCMSTWLSTILMPLAVYASRDWSPHGAFASVAFQKVRIGRSSRCTTELRLVYIKASSH